MKVQEDQMFNDLPTSDFDFQIDDLCFDFEAVAFPENYHPLEASIKVKSASDQLTPKGSRNSKARLAFMEAAPEFKNAVRSLIFVDNKEESARLPDMESKYDDGSFHSSSKGEESSLKLAQRQGSIKPKSKFRTKKEVKAGSRISLPIDDDNIASIQEHQIHSKFNFEKKKENKESLTKGSLRNFSHIVKVGKAKKDKRSVPSMKETNFLGKKNRSTRRMGTQFGTQPPDPFQSIIENIERADGVEDGNFYTPPSKNLKFRAQITVTPAPQTSESSIASTIKEMTLKPDSKIEGKGEPQGKHAYELEPNLHKIVEVSSMSNQNQNDSIRVSKINDSLNLSNNHSSNQGSILLQKRNSKRLALNVKESREDKAQSSKKTVGSRKSGSSRKDVSKGKLSEKAQSRKSRHSISVKKPINQERILAELEDNKIEEEKENNVTSVEKPLTKASFKKNEETSSFSKPNSQPFLIPQSGGDELQSPTHPIPHDSFIQVSQMTTPAALQKPEPPPVQFSSFRKTKDNNKNDKTYNITINESSDTSLQKPDKSFNVPDALIHKKSMDFLTPQVNGVNRKYSSFSAAITQQNPYFQSTKRIKGEPLTVEALPMQGSPLHRNSLVPPTEANSTFNLGSRRSLILHEIEEIDHFRGKLRKEAQNRDSQHKRSTHLGLY